jgi:hypothetical protein
MSTNSASSPIPYMHNHSIDTTMMNDNSEKRRHKSLSEDSKVRNDFQTDFHQQGNYVESHPEFQVGSSSASTTGKSSAQPQPTPPPPPPPHQQQQQTQPQIPKLTSSTSVTASGVLVNTNTSSVLSSKSVVNSATSSAVTMVSSSTPIKAGGPFSTVAATPNNSSPSSGALNGGGSNGALASTTSTVASAVTLALVAVSAAHSSSVAVSPAVTQQHLLLSQPPRQEQPQQQPNFAAAVQQLNGGLDQLDHQQYHGPNGRVSNLSGHASEGRLPPSLQGSQKQPTSVSSSHFSPAPMANSLTVASSSVSFELSLP